LNHIGQQAFTLAVQRKERAQQAYAHKLLGEIASDEARRDVADAEGHYGLALTLAEDMGMRPLVAHCHLGLGNLYRSYGKPLESRDHLMIAAAPYREMDMGFWSEHATELTSVERAQRRAGT
jgi:hypothetical protein